MDIAVDWAQRATTLAECAHPPEHPAVAASWLDLARMQRAAGDAGAAADATARAWVITSTHRTPGSRDWMIQASAYLEMLHATDRFDELVAETARIRDELMGVFGPDDYRVREAERLLVKNTALAIHAQPQNESTAEPTGASVGPESRMER